MHFSFGVIIRGARPFPEDLDDPFRLVIEARRGCGTIMKVPGTIGLSRDKGFTHVVGQTGNAQTAETLSESHPGLEEPSGPNRS